MQYQGKFEDHFIYNKLYLNIINEIGTSEWIKAIKKNSKNKLLLFLMHATLETGIFFIPTLSRNIIRMRLKQRNPMS